MLERFLQRLDVHPVLRIDMVFRRFLEARYTWHEIAHSPPLTLLPRNNLNAPPQNPADPDAPASYAYLPTPSAPLKLAAPNAHFQEAEAFTNRFQTLLSSTLEPANRRLLHRWTDIATDYADLGALLNTQSLAEASGLAHAMERTGQAVDAMYVSLSEMMREWEARVSEPVNEYTQYAAILNKCLLWRHLKHQQLEVAQDLLADKHQRLADHERDEAQAARLNMALENGGTGLISGTRANRQKSIQQQSVFARAAESEDDDNDDQAEEQHHTQQDADDSPETRDPHPQQPAILDTSPWTTELAKNSLSSSPPKATPGTGNAASLSTEGRERMPTPSTQRHGLFGSFKNRFASVMDLDPNRSRQNSISRLREEVVHVRLHSPREHMILTVLQLQEAIELTKKDLDYVNRTIQASLDRFQRLKVQDLKQLMLDMARMHRAFCTKVRATVCASLSHTMTREVSTCTTR